ncbi:MAG: glutamate decarboxylase [Rickettsiaceae bacterium]
MFKHYNKNDTNSTDVCTYASRYDLQDFSVAELSEDGMPAEIAAQFINDELTLETTPILNLASFVTTWMEKEADELIAKYINVNLIDHEEYPKMQEIHSRCVQILAKLLNAPKAKHYCGTITIGSSEAIMLAGLAHKFKWRNKRKSQGKDHSRPNIIMGSNVQICWEKFARYFDVEERVIPIKEGKYIITAKDVEPLIDENTICVAAILGTTFTGEYDEIEEMNDLLLKVKKERGLDIPIHVDGASGAFISMFRDDGIKWDFKLEQVKSINISGHKYGLVYPGVGWVIFRDESALEEDLFFHVNYLGGDMPTYTLNFSRGSSMLVAQYYNFLRLGKSGYTKIVDNMMHVSDFLAKELTKSGKWVVLGDRRMEPVVSIALKDNSKFTVFNVSERLRIYGWIVPAYTMPVNAEKIESLRVVVKENFSLTLAKDFLGHLNNVMKELEDGACKKYVKNRPGKHVTH